MVVKADLEIAAVALARAGIGRLAERRRANEVDGVLAEGQAQGGVVLAVDDERHALDHVEQIRARGLDRDAERLRDRLLIIEEVALEPAREDDGAADGERDVLAADGHLDALVAVAAQTLQIAQRRARHDEAAVVAIALNGLTAQRQTVAVDGDHGQLVVRDLKERAHVDRAALVRAHGEGALVDHLLEQILRQGHAVFGLHARQVGIVLRTHADEVERRAAAPDGDRAVFGLDGDDAVGHTAQHLAEQARADEHAARFGDVCFHIGVDGLFQVIAGDAQIRTCLEQQALERGDRALDFDKILATCRSRGVYCVPILQSLAQLKTLFADGAWEGIVGNCDTFIYLGGNEASTYEYVSKLLGKWTIDKRTSGESKGSSGSYSENYDVLGRELMLEYEIRLLPDDECIIFVRGENPIRDKKWFPWEHEKYLEARKCGAFVPAEQKKIQEKQMEECQFVGDASLAYLKKQKDKSENIQIYGMDAFAFMMMDLDGMGRKIHPVPDEKKSAPTITADMIQTAIEVEKRQDEEEQKTRYLENFGKMSLLDIYSSDMTGSIRRAVIKELLQVGASDEVIKDIVHPKFSEDQVIQKKKMWMEMRGGLETDWQLSRI